MSEYEKICQKPKLELNLDPMVTFNTPSRSNDLIRNTLYQRIANRVRSLNTVRWPITVILLVQTRMRMRTYRLMKKKVKKIYLQFSHTRYIDYYPAWSYFSKWIYWYGVVTISCCKTVLTNSLGQIRPLWVVLEILHIILNNSTPCNEPCNFATATERD